MVRAILSMATIALLTACGGGSVDPEKFLQDQLTYIQQVDESVDSRLAFKTMAGYQRGEEDWNVKVGYIGDKAALVKMISADSRQTTWWLYPDTATGKILFFKEEAPDKNGKGVRNLFGYQDTTLVVAKTGSEPYKPDGDVDFKLKPSAMNNIYREVLIAVEADRPDLSKAANEARAKNAQVFAAGTEPGWSLVINPSKNEIVFTGDYGNEVKTFRYTTPDQGPVGESIYECKDGDALLRATIASKYCRDESGKVYPYSVVIQWNGKSLAGCGLPLQ